jgi:LytS/YehU family sensor histidine kinase
MSLQQLVTTDTDNASKMIEALSEEFHLLTTMTKKKLVPITDEINMCKTHLQIMSIQQRANYQLNVDGIIGDETIPPAVIHTLVENGITHGYSGNENALFELTKSTTATGITYRLFNDSKKKTVNKKSSTGSGLKYIEARLEECYPNRWTLSSNAAENGWEAIIQIHSKA